MIKSMDDIVSILVDVLTEEGAVGHTEGQTRASYFAPYAVMDGDDDEEDHTDVDPGISNYNRLIQAQLSAVSSLFRCTLITR